MATPQVVSRASLGPGHAVSNPAVRWLTFNQAVEEWYANPVNVQQLAAFRALHGPLHFNQEEVRAAFQSKCRQNPANGGFVSPSDRTTTNPGQSNVSRENRVEANELARWVNDQMYVPAHWVPENALRLSSHNKLKSDLRTFRERAEGNQQLQPQDAVELQAMEQQVQIHAEAIDGSWSWKPTRCNWKTRNRN